MQIQHLVSSTTPIDALLSLTLLTRATSRCLVAVCASGVEALLMDEIQVCSSATSEKHIIWCGKGCSPLTAGTSWKSGQATHLQTQFVLQVSGGHFGRTAQIHFRCGQRSSTVSLETSEKFNRNTAKCSLFVVLANTRRSRNLHLRRARHF